VNPKIKKVNMCVCVCVCVCTSGRHVELEEQLLALLTPCVDDCER